MTGTRNANHVEETFRDLCRVVDSPVSLGLWIRYCNAHDELAKASINPLAYDNADDFFLDYAVVNLLRKYKGLDTGLDLEGIAAASFDQAELVCSKTNKRLAAPEFWSEIPPVSRSLISRARQIMERLWGLPSFSDLTRRSGWGPGSTASLPAIKQPGWEQKTTQFPIDVTPSARPYISQVIQRDVHWLRALFGVDVVDNPFVSLLPSCFTEGGSHVKIAFVDKDAKTKRTIGSEPTCNMFLQKGAGQWIRSRLMRVYGVNLDSQEGNQELARLAIRYGLATLDLKSASDTVAYQLVKLICPRDMFVYLDAIRSPGYTLKNRTATRRVRFHKFSSMGNGFTFELESAIFYSLARACVEMEGLSQNHLGVYGDDIIVPSIIAQRLIELLDLMGFAINRDKSFVSGRFYESCGRHYFDGFDVTPAYQKEPLTGALEGMRFLNRLSALVDRYHELPERRVNLIPVWNRAFRRLSDQWPVLSDVTCPSTCVVDGFVRVPDGSNVPVQSITKYDLHGTGRVRVLRMIPKGTRRRRGNHGWYATYMRVSGKEPGSPQHILKSGEAIPFDGYESPRPLDRIRSFKVKEQWLSRLNWFGRV